jgi:hypothetical protein
VVHGYLKEYNSRVGDRRGKRNVCVYVCVDVCERRRKDLKYSHMVTTR